MTNVRLRYVDRFRDSGGKMRFYFRKPNGPRTPLPGAPGSEEFLRAYAIAARGVLPASGQMRAAAPGTFDHLLRLYFAAPEFRALAPSTQRAYRLVIERWVRDEKIGHRPVAGMRREHVSTMIGKRAHTPGAANDLAKKIRLLMNFAIAHGLRTDNPTAKMKKFKGEEWHTWTDDEIERFEKRWPVGTSERLAMGLLLFTGQRRSDVVKMTWQDIRGEAIRVCQVKTKKKLDVALHPDLRAILAATPRTGETILTTAYGKPFSAAGFGNWMADKIDAAGLPKECITHGLRKAAARRLAEAGCSASEIMAVTGHTTLSEVERYVREASQKLLSKAGIARLVSQRAA